mmetsp:Transcript_73148/g.145477  ORF Transcript_73148/g.145477 Transcript_73148/m.145477 type:complete len:263 (-) Transcript_73148:135-923(-)
MDSKPPSLPTVASGAVRRAYGGCQEAASTAPPSATLLVSLPTRRMRSAAQASRGTPRRYKSSLTHLRSASLISCAGFGKHTTRAPAWDRATTAGRSTARASTGLMTSRRRSSKRARPLTPRPWPRQANAAPLPRRLQRPPTTQHSSTTEKIITSNTLPSRGRGHIARLSLKSSLCRRLRIGLPKGWSTTRPSCQPPSGTSTGPRRIASSARLTHPSNGATGERGRCSRMCSCASVIRARGSARSKGCTHTHIVEQLLRSALL